MPRYSAAASAFVLGILLPVALAAYPIRPQPLWPLTEEAELIVIAEVRGIDPLKREEDAWNDAVARLKVVETLKGVKLSEVKVPYPANLVCPAPPRYEVGETVVAFLVKDKGSWRTVSLSYGTLYPQGDELEDLRTMVRAAVELQALSLDDKGMALDDKAMELRKREWLVQAAALPGTRWHGLYELAPRTLPWSSNLGSSARSRGPVLSRSQQALLAEAFISQPKRDNPYSFSMMLRVLSSYDDPRVDLLALETLEGLLTEEEPPSWTGDLLWLVLARFGDPVPVERLKGLDAKPWKITPQQIREIWSDAKSDLDIPDVTATEVEAEP